VSREKTERLLNVTLALLGTRTFLTKEQILSTVQGYGGPSESADRMFERDKDDLREMGIPIEMRGIDPLFEDEPGYRIDRRHYQLPPLQFTAREMAWLSIASDAWQQAALAGAAADGLRKLIAAGAEPDHETLESLRPAMSTQEPAFGPLWSGVRDRVAMAFAYRSAGTTDAQERHVDPWGLLSRAGGWYLVGRDRDRDQVRVFRLSRIVGDPRPTGKPGEFSVPAGVDLWSHVALLDAPAQHRYLATLLAAPGHALALRRRATAVTVGETGEWDRIELPVSDTDLIARQVAALGAHVRVVEPEELRSAVVSLLTQVVDHHG
jgi:proteasome accessory factor B